MRVALFVPCYIDQLYPHVAIATLELLERMGCTVSYPLDQTCCGQPMANAGFEGYSEKAMQVFAENFSMYEYIVAPSGSCVLHVREHLKPLEEDEAPFASRVYELCQFLMDVLHVPAFEGQFPYRVGLHESCHGLRGLRLGVSSELQASSIEGGDPSVPAQLLGMKAGVELVSLDRPDECCGFGGTFAVSEEAVSVKMGLDRLEDHEAHAVEVITSTDMSCLMHLDGLIQREKIPLKAMHIAEILNA